MIKPVRKVCTIDLRSGDVIMFYKSKDDNLSDMLTERALVFPDWDVPQYIDIEAIIATVVSVEHQKVWANGGGNRFVKNLTAGTTQVNTVEFGGVLFDSNDVVQILIFSKNGRKREQHR